MRDVLHIGLADGLAMYSLIGIVWGLNLYWLTEIDIDCTAVDLSCLRCLPFSRV